jgi:YVTN family beta-propeller protein
MALVADAAGKTLYVSAHTAKQVLVFDVAAGRVAKSIPLPDRPGGLALAPDGKRLYVAGASPAGRVHVIDTGTLAPAGTLPAGHTPCALAASPDGARLYVCNRFDHDVSVVDLASGKATARIAVLREPVAAALTPDGRRLLVANHLPAGPANGEVTAAAVSVIDTGTGAVAATVALPNGSTGMRGLCLSPDGQFAYVTHLLARYALPTTQLERGWMNTNALSILRTADAKPVNTVLLDSVDLGAANPWGVACSADGAWLCVAHAGTHEISVIDRAALHAKLDQAASGKKVTEVTSYGSDVPNDLSFLHALRRRIRLAGNGPRGVAVAGGKAWAAEYFSDSLGVADLAPAPRPAVQSIRLAAAPPPETDARRGERSFNDADHCFQKWQSCASCHPDARADALNWDLLNDGIGNPKNTRNMLMAAQTPPSMSLGTREDFGAAVRAGFRVIQFTTPPEEEVRAVEAYLTALRPMPGPRRVRGPSPAAKRGEAVFASAGCAACHPPPLFTDLKTHDLGIGLGLDRGKSFDTPTLVEAWRTAPYLYDGRAVTIKEVLTTHNAGDRHGHVSKLSPEDLDALIDYVLSQ